MKDYRQKNNDGMHKSARGFGTFWVSLGLKLDAAAADSGRAGLASGGPPATHLGDADPTPPPNAATSVTAPDRLVGPGATPDGPR